jgi:two-component system sensor histidine kinase SenX3
MRHRRAAYDLGVGSGVTVVIVLVAGLAVGAAAGVFGALAWLRRREQVPGDGPVTVPGTAGTSRPTGLARRSLELMTLGVIVLDSGNEPVIVNEAAAELGVADGQRVSAPLLRLARRARHDGRSQSADVELPAPPAGAGTGPVSAVRVEAHPMDISGHVALFVEDLSAARLVDIVRRDFVANVSHELKTPVGALALLAEAIVEGYDTDPDEVRHFAERMRHESSRLARLVQDLIDLSRLQGAEVAVEPDPVPVADVIAEAVDRSRLAAAARNIAVVTGPAQGATVRGNAAQLVTAVANLVDNAIAYSPDHTTVSLSVRTDDATVAIAVSDEGIGIAESDLQRVFERFYRADPARSRATGGTGLGLAIVKHIVTNHGGAVRVWSVPGEGSTFTLTLPAAEPVPARPLEKGHV